MFSNQMNKGRMRILIYAFFLVPTICGLGVPAWAAVPEEPIPLPVYRSGTTFVYSDGTWETVVNASDGEVVWKEQDGFLSVGSPDFTHRRTRWESDTRQGARTFGPRDDLLLRGDTSVWPLKPGNVAHFRETGVWSENHGPEQAYSAQWSCEVAGRQMVAVPAGAFDAWKIDCSRFSLLGGSNASRLWETWTWYYAPAVGHYVLAVSKHIEDREPQRRELLAVLPPAEDMPPETRRRMEESLQQALESSPSGRRLAWSGLDARISGETTPSGTFRGGDGTFCRRYVQSIDDPEGRRNYYGMACRTPEGKWAVPRR